MLQIGQTGYEENYLSSESNIVFYNEENLWIVKHIVKAMNDLLENIENDYKKDYQKIGGKENEDRIAWFWRCWQRRI